MYLYIYIWQIGEPIRQLRIPWPAKSRKNAQDQFKISPLDRIRTVINRIELISKKLKGTLGREKIHEAKVGCKLGREINF